MIVDLERVLILSGYSADFLKSINQAQRAALIEDHKTSVTQAKLRLEDALRRGNRQAAHSEVDIMIDNQRLVEDLEEAGS